MATGTYQTAGIVNLILGLWLFISAFLWPHTREQLTNTWIVGVLCVAFSLASMRIAEIRYLNTALAVWLFLSVWALPALNIGTMWNNALVAVAVFFVSLSSNYLPGRSQPLPRA